MSDEQTPAGEGVGERLDPGGWKRSGPSEPTDQSPRIVDALVSAGCSTPTPDRPVPDIGLEAISANEGCPSVAGQAGVSRKGRPSGRYPRKAQDWPTDVFSGGLRGRGVPSQENSPTGRTGAQASIFDLFGVGDRAVARASDPETSHEAADSVTAILETQGRILELLAEGPGTDEEIAARWRWGQVSPSGLRTRRHELVDRGLVEWTGERRRLETGRYARVWRVK